MEPPVLDSLLFASRAGLKQSWPRILAKSAQKCLTSLDEKVAGPAGDDPLSALQAIKRFWERTRGLFLETVALRASQADLTQLLGGILDETIIVSPERMEAKQRELDDLHRQEADATTHLSEMQSLERHFQDWSGSGVGLEDVLRSIRTNGPAWSLLPQCSDPFMQPPEAVVNWVKAAVSALDSGGVPADDTLSQWLVQVRDTRMRLGAEKARLSGEIDRISRSVSASRRLHDASERLPNLRAILADIAAGGREEVPGRDLAEMVSSGAAAQPVLDSAPIDGVITSVNRWIEIERQALDREETLRRDDRYNRIKTTAEELARAMDRETGKQGVLVNMGLVPPDVREQFSRDVNYVLGHLRNVDGVLPVNLYQGRSSSRGKTAPWEVRTNDGRGFSSLSYGQRVQIAVSMVIALNAALRDILWFDVIAFDDFTSALDMTNLPRLATLLRRIAYGDGQGTNGATKAFRRQIFVVSHHEDMTNRLLDFLIPPEGHSLRVLKFVNWTPRKGPTIEEMSIRAGASASRAKEKLQRLLARRLEREFA
ncbi:MAG: hypothetical protein HPY55_11100 [Firmicutes bacterium]|nr:hypothetical protein [Bacillota bacterium]